MSVIMCLLAAYVVAAYVTHSMPPEPLFPALIRAVWFAESALHSTARTMRHIAVHRTSARSCSHTYCVHGIVRSLEYNPGLAVRV